MAPVEHDGFKINLLDALGYADFIGDVRSALPAADGVLFVVSAVEGVETRPGRLDHGRGAGPALPFFINKLDRDRASFARSLDGIQAAFGKACAPCTCPSARSTTSTAWSACCRPGLLPMRTASAARATSPPT